MLFSSLEFLYGFLPLVLILYFAVPFRLKNYVLLIFSLGFYFYGEQTRIILMLVCVAACYIGALLIDKVKRKGLKKLFLWLSIGVCLGMLGVFKYADFFIGNVNSLTGASFALTGIILPIGISFYTFQALSYVVDVYRGNVAVQKNPFMLATYVSYFPQLIAGPIVRYQEVEKELAFRRHTFEGFAEGVKRLVLGLGKKVLVANVLYSLCETFKAQENPTTLFYWLYIISYTLHLYFDFSGYSDMAIGLGKMMGFKFPENFNYPFISRSVSEFWRRWHMTLGSWFRDYVYFPLGGSRVGKLKLVRNLFVVWMFTGLWHGAAWNFVIWGVYFGLLLVGEKLLWGKALEKLPKVIQHAYVIILLLISFVVFDSTSFAEMLRNLKGVFGIGTSGFADTTSLYYLLSFLPIIVTATFLSTPAMSLFAKKLNANNTTATALSVITPIGLALMLIAVTAFLVDGSFNPFLYFRF